MLRLQPPPLVDSSQFTATTFKEAQAIVREFNDHNACAVIALMLATGLDYPTISTTLQRMGRKQNHGTTITAMRRALNLLGCETEKIPAAKLGIKTINNVVELANTSPVFKNKIMLVSSTEHIACMASGAILDHITTGKYLVDALYYIKYEGAELRARDLEIVNMENELAELDFSL